MKNIAIILVNGVLIPFIAIGWVAGVIVKIGRLIMSALAEGYLAGSGQ